MILGDFVHGKSSVTEGLAESLRSWRRRRSHLDCVVVLGNHDRRAAPLYDGCGFRIANEPTLAAGLDCRHYPLDGQARTQGPVTLAGHLHPVARISGRGRDSLRLPCFVLDGRQIVLPAFGEFTGGSLVRPDEGRGIVLVASGRLIELPRPAPTSAAGL